MVAAEDAASDAVVRSFEKLVKQWYRRQMDHHQCHTEEAGVTDPDASTTSPDSDPAWNSVESSLNALHSHVRPALEELLRDDLMALHGGATAYRYVGKQPKEPELIEPFQWVTAVPSLGMAELAATTSETALFTVLENENDNLENNGLYHFTRDAWINGFVKLLFTPLFLATGHSDLKAPRTFMNHSHDAQLGLQKAQEEHFRFLQMYELGGRPLGRLAAAAPGDRRVLTAVATAPTSAGIVPELQELARAFGAKKAELKGNERRKQGQAAAP